MATAWQLVSLVHVLLVGVLLLEGLLLIVVAVAGVPNDRHVAPPALLQAAVPSTLEPDVGAGGGEVVGRGNRGPDYADKIQLRIYGNPNIDRELKMLLNDPAVDRLSSGTTESDPYVDVIVPRHMLDSIHSKWRTNVTVEDLSSAMKEASRRARRSSRYFAAALTSHHGGHEVPSVRTLIDTHQIQNSFLDGLEIEAFLRDFARWYPDLVTLSMIGRSYENRPMWAIRLGTPRPTNQRAKPAFVILSTLHPREWISTAVVLNAIPKLIESYHHHHPEVRNILDSIDLYVVPLANPDGYNYTMIPGGDRLWRKNRQPTTQGCIGIDLNRNFAFHWGSDKPAERKLHPCHNTYEGATPGSATEIQVITQWMTNLKKNQTLVGLYDFHSYGELWMYPNGYTCEPPKEEKKLQKITDRVVETTHRKFSGGAICKKLYQARGSSVDWAAGILNMTYSFAVELSPDRNTSKGFLVKESDILEGFEPAYAGFLTAIQETIKVPKVKREVKRSNQRVSNHSPTMVGYSASSLLGTVILPVLVLFA